MLSLKDIKRSLRYLQRKNTCILGHLDKPAKKGAINYERWSSNSLKGENLGDYLADVVCDWMVSRVELEDKRPGETRFLASVGSVLGMGYNDCTVWGSGFLNAKAADLIFPAVKHLDIRAVRGPNTKRALENKGYTCPEVFGDPAILMPLIYAGKQQECQGPLLIKHYATTALEGEESLRTAEICTTDYQGFIDALLASSIVISTSLHGVILAESYGVPAVLLKDSRADFDLFKYEDWYLSTGRTSFPVACTVQEALQLQPAELPRLSSMQHKLMEVFPYDLWDPTRK